MDGLLSGPGASGLRADDADGAAGPRRGLSVYLLGPLRIFRDGHPVEGGWRRKSLELLAYLAAHPRGAARDQVLEALWPGADPKVSQSNLWHSASHLRCRLRRPGDNARIVQKIDDRYRMDFAHVWVDVVAFEEAIRRSRDSGNRGALLEVACSLYRGEYCEGWYYGWAALVIERYQGLFVQAAKDWALLLQASDQVDEALQLLDRALAADPYDEELYRQAMVLENGRGRADLVARRYRLLRRLMIEELGIEPSMQTSAVLRQLEAAP